MKKPKKGLTKDKKVSIKCVKSCSTTEPEQHWQEGKTYKINKDLARQLSHSPHFIITKLT